MLPASITIVPLGELVTPPPSAVSTSVSFSEIRPPLRVRSPVLYIPPALDFAVFDMILVSLIVAEPLSI